MSGRVAGALLATVTGVLTATYALQPALQEQQRKRFEEEHSKAENNSPLVPAPREAAQQTISNAQPDIGKTKNATSEPSKAAPSSWSSIGRWAGLSKVEQKSSDPPKETPPANSQQGES
ncbi:uncharacterized protein BDZ99DRAFT_39050 [Mytilinidion resinicola]|uniref:Uncharacterized protein n=1 Tax=Mytilinidion resinicola TaxID=574789 RepID=A0A6A6YLA3_9PEZI|nr:uncharacterized protein BDZ99DRAFT_39050 [Mytilinidion resinicola]KAF2808754.1 hypothetical protein BDZ99DRAFT_39050 [Mytilinidion resinicola]